MNHSGTFAIRVATLGFGYALMLLGVLSVFIIPFYVSVILFLAGSVVISVSDRARIPMTWKLWMVLMVGWILICGGLAFYGEDRVRDWRPFPGTYFAAWIACFYGFRHVRHLVLTRGARS